MPTIAAFHDYHPLAARYLSTKGIAVQDVQSLDDVAGASAMTFRSSLDLREPAILDRLAERGVELLITRTHGLDHINTAYAGDRGITVCHTPCNAADVAALVFTQIGNLLRDPGNAHEDMSQGLWPKSDYVGGSTEGLTLGIIGCGRIGQRVARVADCYGMQILGYDVLDEAELRLRHGESPIRYVALPELLQHANIITIHVDGREPVIRREHYDMMGKKPYMINAARGGNLESHAFVQALRAGRLSGGALDVFEVEPLPQDHAITEYVRESEESGLPPLLLTPHIGGNTERAVLKQSILAAEIAHQYFNFMKVYSPAPVHYLNGRSIVPGLPSMPF